MKVFLILSNLLCKHEQPIFEVEAHLLVFVRSQGGIRLRVIVLLHHQEVILIGLVFLKRGWAITGLI